MSSSGIVTSQSFTSSDACFDERYGVHESSYEASDTNTLIVNLSNLINGFENEDTTLKEADKLIVSFFREVSLQYNGLSSDNKKRLLANIKDKLSSTAPRSALAFTLRTAQEVLDQQEILHHGCLDRTVHRWRRLSSMSATIYALIATVVGLALSSQIPGSCENKCSPKNAGFYVNTGITILSFGALFLMRTCLHELTRCCSKNS